MMASAVATRSLDGDWKSPLHNHPAIARPNMGMIRHSVFFMLFLPPSPVRRFHSFPHIAMVVISSKGSRITRP
jgi:hypothetical protein